MMDFKHILASLILLGFSSQGFCAIDHAWRLEDKSQGYVDDLSLEEDAGEPLFFVANPQANEKPLKEIIFDEDLSKKLSLRYQETFGRTQAEVFYSKVSVSGTYVMEGRQVSEDEYVQKQRDFSNYMFRKTIEYHVKEKAKKDPNVKAVWQTKERLSKFKLKISENIRFKAKYSISANDLKFRVLNPWVRTLLRMQMDSSAVGPTDVEMMILTLGRKLTKSVDVQTHYNLTNSSFQLVGVKNLSPVLSVSITASPNYLNDSHSELFVDEERPREKLFLCGLSYIF